MKILSEWKKVLGLGLLIMVVGLLCAAGPAVAAEKLAIATVYPGNMTDGNFLRPLAAKCNRDK